MCGNNAGVRRLWRGDELEYKYRCMAGESLKSKATEELWKEQEGRDARRCKILDAQDELFGDPPLRDAEGDLNPNLLSPKLRRRYDKYEQAADALEEEYSIVELELMERCDKARAASRGISRGSS